MPKPASPWVLVWLFGFVATFLSIFALGLTSIGHHMLTRGNFTFTPREGPVQLISSTTHPGVFWATSLGFSSVGALMFVAAAVSLFVAIRILARTWRTRGETTFMRPNPIGIALICIAGILIVFAFAVRGCSHQ